MTKRCVVAALALAALTTAGCSVVLIAGGAAAGVGGVVWQRGWLVATMEEPQDRVFRAAGNALSDLKIAVEDKSLDEKSGVVDGYAQDSKRVMVKTRPQADKGTKVSIRVGFWGDQTRSLQIFEQMKKHL